MKHFLIMLKDKHTRGYVVRAKNIEDALRLGKARWIEELGHDCLVIAEHLPGFYDNKGIRERNKNKGKEAN